MDERSRYLGGFAESSLRNEEAWGTDRDTCLLRSFDGGEAVDRRVAPAFRAFGNESGETFRRGKLQRAAPLKKVVV
jgi:hypothetical protein